MRQFANSCSGRLAAGIAATALLLAAGTAAAQEYNWTFQTSETAGEPTFEIKQEWAQMVEEMTGGRIHIEILPVGAVVPHSETLDAVGAGILQGHLTDPSYFAGRDPAFAMLGNLVGAWGDPLEFLEYMNYGGGEQLYNELVEPYNVHLIGASATGLEAFVSAVPIRSIEDMQGLRMRAPEGMVYDVFTRAGASPVNLPGSEVYTSLERGVIDAADYTVFVTNHALGLHEFARYPGYPGFHSLPMVAVSINLDIWNELPADLQRILEVSVDQLAYDTVFRLRALDLAAVAEAEADPNIEIIDLPAEERRRFRAIAQEVWAEWATRTELTQRIYDSVTTFLQSRNLL
ncbi:MAG: TRAP transporter substrate-binding protein [Rhodospirillaceae bacterium]|nr:TRAP transporter substrate-binding protein [Rhodospirillaceae bacterium]